MNNNLSRTMTISTKVTVAQKALLERLARQKGITPSEFYCTLILTFKEHYDYIGEGSPVEKKLIVELEQLMHGLGQVKNELAEMKEKKNELQAELSKCKSELSQVKIAFLKMVTE